MTPQTRRLVALAADLLAGPLRDRIALAIAAVAFALGAYAFAFVEPDSGVRLTVVGDRVFVSDVEGGSPARTWGITPGMLVVRLNGQDLITIPGYSEKLEEYPLAQDLVNQPVYSLEAIPPWQVEEVQTAGPTFDGILFQAFYNEPSSWLDGSGLAPLLGLALLFGIGWWLATGRGGASLAPLAVPLAVATAVPLLLLPLRLAGGPVAGTLASGLLALGLWPLADGLAERVTPATTRRKVGFAIAGLMAASFATGAFAPFLLGGVLYLAWAVLAGLVTFVPGIVAAVRDTPDGRSASALLVQSRELAVVGATPFFAILALTFSTSDPVVLPILLWILVLLIVGRFTIRPLVRLATRAQLQRDLVVAATEAERARVAADIHDDALQELTLLVRRLDASGDVEGAELARTVSDRLRAICGDLRLPILDDLGVGPALDWLVLRVERLAGGEVRLERADGSRPPADVELAIFRVAQEALANAVKHGRPPIVVRYRATPSGVSLSVDDAGPGIAPEAGDEAERSGHFGLLNMQQRAEQIGAILDVRRWPGGGTHVALEWRPR